MTDATVTEVINSVAQPKAVIMVHNDVSVKAVGNTVPIYIGNAKHVDLLVYLGAETGAASIRYHIAVIEAVSGKTVKTYDGTEKTATGVDSISIDALTLGDWIKVTWTTAGTLSDDHWFANVTARLVVK